MRHKLGMIAGGPYNRAKLETLIRLQEDAVEHVSKATMLSPIEAADREDAVADWLDDHGIAGGWDLAPTFVQAGLEIGWLEKVAATVGEDSLEGALRWLNCTVETEQLMNEIRTPLAARPWSPRPSNTRNWTGRPTRSLTCMSCSRARC